jgi:hypothetical protein
MKAVKSRLDELGRFRHNPRPNSNRRNSMKVVKKTDEYTIMQRRDNRYAVEDANKKPVNGDEKAKILSAEGLIKLPEPKAAPVEEEAPAEAAAEAAPAEEAAE